MLDNRVWRDISISKGNPLYSYTDIKWVFSRQTVENGFVSIQSVLKSLPEKYLVDIQVY